MLRRRYLKSGTNGVKMGLIFENIKDYCMYLEIFIDAKEDYKVIQCQHKRNSVWKCCEEDCPLY